MKKITSLLDIHQGNIEAKNQRTWLFYKPIKKCVVMLSLLAAFTFIPNHIYAQFTQQGAKLVGTGAMNSPFGAAQGESVSISSDGNTAIVGGSDDNNSKGAAWIFTRMGGVWSQQGTKLIGKGAKGVYGPYQGGSVSISGDGNTAIVGGVGDNKFIGAAWVFSRSGGIWRQQGSKLVGKDGVGGFNDEGESVSISADGNTAIVGGYDDNNGTGAAWIYTRASGVWTQQGNKLVGTGVAGQGAGQGRSVSISADGNTAIIGGPGDGSHYPTIGAVWIFTRTNGVWAQQGSKLVGTGAVNTSGTYQGTSVSISSDGNTAIVGGWKDNNGIGAAWVYTRSGGVWTQQGSKLVGIGAIGASTQGWSVSISSDGNTAFLGGQGDNSGAGAIWVFARTGGVWTQQGNKLMGTGAVGAANQGESVSISSDGSTAIVGGPEDNNQAGAAWIYTNSNSSNLSQANSYCTSKGTNTTHGYINKVSMETINNTSGNNAGYADFTSQSAKLQKGATYTIELTPGFSAGDYVAYWTVYIDYNHDGIFEPDEIVGEKNAYIKVNKSFTIPTTALNGRTRMRIQMQAGAQETDPCATYTYGEVEDYTVALAGKASDLVQGNSDLKNMTEKNAIGFSLYPNPTKDNLTVEFIGNDESNADMKVYNLSGQMVINIGNVFVSGETTYNLNTRSLGSGTYILEIETNGQTQHQKFLISK